jgi:hypothetical protein
VTSAIWGVIRPPSHGLFLIRDDGRERRDVRVKVGRTAIMNVTVVNIAHVRYRHIGGDITQCYGPRKGTRRL